MLDCVLLQYTHTLLSLYDFARRPAYVTLYIHLHNPLVHLHIHI